MAAFHVPASGRPRTVVPAILLAVLVLAGCAAAGAPSPTVPALTPNPTDAPTAPPPAFPVTVTDDEGTAVAIGAAPTKIVSLGADLVISGGANFGQGDAVAQLRRANVPVLVVGPTTTSGVIADIRFIGQATGASATANHVADSMAAAFATVKTATAGTAHPKVFYEIDATGAIYTAAKGSFLEELLTLAGADPVTTASSSAYDIPLETLVTANPSIILLGDAAYGTTADQVKARSGWGTIAAVQSGTILAVDDTVITRPGPRLVEGLLALVKAIHPDLVLPSFPPA